MKTTAVNYKFTAHMVIPKDDIDDLPSPGDTFMELPVSTLSIKYYDRGMVEVEIICVGYATVGDDY